MARDETGTVVYTDGACKGNPGPGGWAWVVADGRNGSGGAEQTTNQRMELQAVLEAVRALEGPLDVHSDSTYVVNCFNDRWYDGWIKRGWKNSQKKPVANRDLWEPLIEEYLARSDEITFTWVKGHAGDPMKERADELPVAAAALVAGEGSATTSPSADLRPPWAVERAIWVVGVVDPDDDQLAAVTRSVEALDPTNDVLVSGVRRGVELVAAEHGLRLGVELMVVLPFADPALRWPAADKERFDDAVRRAADRVELAGDPRSPGKAVEERNRWIGDNVVGAIVVGDDILAAELGDAGVSVIEIP